MTPNEHIDAQFTIYIDNWGHLWERQHMTKYCLFDLQHTGENFAKKCPKMTFGMLSTYEKQQNEYYIAHKTIDRNYLIELDTISPALRLKCCLFNVKCLLEPYIYMVVHQ